MLVLFEESGPELAPDLIAALADLHCYRFSHFCLGLEPIRRVVSIW
jgi:hypothetical protein